MKAKTQIINYKFSFVVFPETWSQVKIWKPVDCLVAAVVKGFKRPMLPVSSLF